MEKQTTVLLLLAVSVMTAIGASIINLNVGFSHPPSEYTLIASICFSVFFAAIVIHRRALTFFKEIKPKVDGALNNRNLMKANKQAKAYKELLDSGLLSQSEYDSKMAALKRSL